MRRRRWIWLGMVLILSWAGLSWMGARQLSHPPRRPLQPYHTDILAGSARHGLRILRVTTGDGTPVLLCEPDGEPSAKGRQVRAELAARSREPAAHGRVVSTLVLLHGRRGRKEDWLPAAERFCAVGFRCLIPDLPGHGDHPHPAATYGQHEAGLPRHWVDECAGRFGFTPGRPALIGLSMGGAVAIQAAAHDPGYWSSLAVVATFDRLEDTVRGQAEAAVGSPLAWLWMAGVRPAFACQTSLPLSRIESLTAASTLKLPVLVAHGSADRIIPLSRGRLLFDTFGSPAKTWVEVPGADHSTVLITRFPLYATLAEWATAHAKGL